MRIKHLTGGPRPTDQQIIVPPFRPLRSLQTISAILRLRSRRLLLLQSSSFSRPPPNLPSSFLRSSSIGSLYPPAGEAGGGGAARERGGSLESCNNRNSCRCSPSARARPSSLLPVRVGGLRPPASAGKKTEQFKETTRAALPNRWHGAGMRARGLGGGGGRERVLG